MHTEFWQANLSQNVLLEHRERDERIILKQILWRMVVKIGAEWKSQNRVQWRGLVSVVLKLLVLLIQRLLLMIADMCRTV
jgi:hypothetical protein